MALSLLSAFVAPSRFATAGRLRFDALLIPVSEPSYHLVNWVRRHLSREPSQDTRDNQEIIEENLALKEQVRQLQGTVEHLQIVAGEKLSLGDLKSLCDRFRVTGSDPDNHEGLFITGSGLSRVQKDQPVITQGNQVVELMGEITDVSALSAHLRLITDAGSVVDGHFITFSQKEGEHENEKLLAIVRGRGTTSGGIGQMSITNLSFIEVSNIHVGDWVVLGDESWPAAVQHIRIGRVASIDKLAKQPLFADIKLDTGSNLMHASDVWVVTHNE
jgi:cell shape-determining protein MreC